MLTWQCAVRQDIIQLVAMHQHTVQQRLPTLPNTPTSSHTHAHTKYVSDYFQGRGYNFLDLVWREVAATTEWMTIVVHVDGGWLALWRCCGSKSKTHALHWGKSWLDYQHLIPLYPSHPWCITAVYHDNTKGTVRSGYFPSFYLQTPPLRPSDLAIQEQWEGGPPRAPLTCKAF